MNAIRIQQVLFSIYIFFFIIFSTSGLGFVGWKLVFSQYQTYFLLLVPFLLTVINFGRVIKIKNYWKRIVIYLAVMPIISTISKMVVIGESFGSVLSPVFISLSFCFFFPFCIYKIRPNTIIVPLFVIAIITVAIQIYQQTTQIIVFDAWAELYELSERNNLLRFWVGTPYIQMFCMFFCWYKFVKTKSVFFLAFFLLFFTSVYLYLTRQLIIASVISLLFSVLLESDKKTRKWIVLSSIAFVTIVYFYWDVLAAGFFEEAKEDSYSTDIRFEAIPFFIEQSVDSVLGFFLGHGHSHFEEKWYSRGYFASDIGFIGDMYHFGISWVLVYFYTTYLFLVKIRKKIPLYLTMYIAAALVYSLFGFPYHSFDTAFLWVCILYISGLYLNASRKKKRNHHNQLLTRPHQIKVASSNS